MKASHPVKVSQYKVTLDSNQQSVNLNDIFQGRSRIGSVFSRSEWLDHAEGASTSFMVASGGVLSEGYGHGGLGVCRGDGQTESYLRDMGMTGLASAWAMARRRPISGIWA